MRKFRCTENSGCDFWTKGKVYHEDENGYIYDNDGTPRAVKGYIDLGEARIPDFEEIFEKAQDEALIAEVLYGTKTTIIKWSDGTQTEAVCSDADNFDKQVGFAIAYTRKMNGGKLHE
jgi:hypothetical protein